MTTQANGYSTRIHLAANCFRRKSLGLTGALAVAALLSPILANAGQTVSTIERVLLYDGGMLVYVYPTGGVNGPPLCHGSNGNYYSFSMSRPMAKEYLAGLLAAQARGATVTFRGTGTCRDQSVSETLDYFWIES